MTRPETRAIHHAQPPDPATGAVIPPIHLTTTYERDIDGAYPREFKYTRNMNPNRAALESVIAELEGGFGAAAFASGSVATMMLLQALRPGDHVIAPDDLYYGIRLIMQDVLMPWGLRVTFVDATDLDAVRAAVTPDTKLILSESPSNPLLQVTDIAGVAQIAQEAGALYMCDNTIGTPVLQQPLQLGADFVIHSTTKYIGGHHDILGGVVVAREDGEMWQRVQMLQAIGGAVPSPFECWLALRGVQTMSYRVRAQADHALKLAQYLADHPNVEKVRYPGLPDHPNHDVARRQMAGFGGLLSVQVVGDEARAMDVIAKMQVFTRATSFGGTHSLIEHRASMEHDGTTTPRNLLRVSVGLEHIDDLIEDFARALA